MKSNPSETSDKNELVKTSEAQQVEKKTCPKLDKLELPETGEVEISAEATANRPAKRIRFPRENFKRFRLKPDRFKQTQNAIDQWNEQCRAERAVYTNSFEGMVGYSSLFRIMRRYHSERIAYFRSEEGGSLSNEEAREKIYSEQIEDEEACQKLFEYLMTIPVDWISFSQLWDLARDSTNTAENVWELIKREAANEFESGHLAANSLEPLGSKRDAWTRAKYIAIRESFCAEYEPRGAIETGMVDLLAQNWFMVQWWTNELSQRMMTEPKRLPYEYRKQREQFKELHPQRWEEEKGFWEIPTISETEAIEKAAAMLDRFQRMFFRTLRQLRDWRRYTPPVIINNAQQINLATNGGQQINVSEAKSEYEK
jgi:uncharacterized cysteine cluster protein YcgN (CxxCxxCC family)